MLDKNDIQYVINMFLQKVVIMLKIAVVVIASATTTTITTRLLLCVLCSSLCYSRDYSRLGRVP